MLGSPVCKQIKSEIKFEDFSSPYILSHKKHSKENRLNWGAILFVFPKETDKHRRGLGGKEEEARYSC